MLPFNNFLGFFTNILTLFLGFIFMQSNLRYVLFKIIVWVFYLSTPFTLEIQKCKKKKSKKKPHTNYGHFLLFKTWMYKR